MRPLLSACVWPALLAAFALSGCASAPYESPASRSFADPGPCVAKAAQSPIRIDPSEAAESNLAAPKIDYSATAVTLWNKDGKTLQIDYSAGSGNSILLDGVRFDLVELHFHQPIEHQIVGNQAAMELHLVHADARGQVAVVGVQVRIGGDGKGTLDRLFAAIPQQPGWRALLPRAFDATGLLPSAPGRIYRYPGSLTTPPFTECLRWVVYEQPAFVSQLGFELYLARFPKPYSHPTQPLNGRVPLKARGSR